MNSAPPPERSLLLWPGIVAALLVVSLRYGLPYFVPDALPIGAFAGLLGWVGVIVWWAFFSGAPRGERWWGSGLMIGAMFVARGLSHESISTGMMGLLVLFYGAPILCLAFVGWSQVRSHLAPGARVGSLALVVLLGCLPWPFMRTDGITGGGGSDFEWRWTPTAEEQLLSRQEATPDSTTDAPAAKVPGGELQAGSWPGFRGPERNGIVRGVSLDTDWSSSPPVELWRRPIGPGWSSFAVEGGLSYTQEQRGEEELVTGYDLATGQPVWTHRDPVRFWESNAGAGPRATPTLAGGRVYTLGATGRVNALDARDGRLLWSRDAASDTGARVPEWGMSASPLVVDDLVLVAASGTLIAYDAGTGEPRWTGASTQESYSSPHLATFGGVEQVLLMTEAGLSSHAPSDGALLWEHAWSGSTIVQPAPIDDTSLLISTGATAGTRRLTVTGGTGAWDVTESWTSNRLKPYFNDFVLHESHAYGLDRGILTCIDLEGGTRQWKSGRYGSGQLILVAEQGVLIILSEEGELALVAADDEAFRELARVPSIEGKTWNHPVLTGDVLLVRNGETMVAYRLALLDG